MALTAPAVTWPKPVDPEGNEFDINDGSPWRVGHPTVPGAGTPMGLG